MASGSKEGTSWAPLLCCFSYAEVRGEGARGKALAHLPWLSPRRTGELACGVQALGCVCRTRQPPDWEESPLAGGQCLHSS